MFEHIYPGGNCGPRPTSGPSREGNWEGAGGATPSQPDLILTFGGENPRGGAAVEAASADNHPGGSDRPGFCERPTAPLSSCMSQASLAVPPIVPKSTAPDARSPGNCSVLNACNGPPKVNIALPAMRPSSVIA